MGASLIQELHLSTVGRLGRKREDNIKKKQNEYVKRYGLDSYDSGEGPVPGFVVLVMNLRTAYLDYFLCELENKNKYLYDLSTKYWKKN